MSLSKKKCPVPFDQQPLNEYISLKSSWFFSWSTLSLDRYLIKLLTIFIFVSLSLMPLLLYIVSKTYSIWKIVFFNILIATIILLLIFIRLYLGWSYIIKRLISATIFYEESGWYDGQLWVKSPEILTKDRIIGLYEVMPFLFRAKYGIIVSLVVIFLEKVIYSLLLT
uniref:Ycf36 n=1 Tax=Gracilaria vermiculophylla TaxID=2608709 RepID=A0A345U914_9FLOR|nr:hypothetical protein [Gracilaria vermiculophylla]AXI96950.1 hypothetical protein [Gracilaria vermiculophylla]QXU75155.1 hypothetical protein [Gracilaria vermiculophylla]